MTHLHVHLPRVSHAQSGTRSAKATASEATAKRVPPPPDDTVDLTIDANAFMALEQRMAAFDQAQAERAEAMRQYNVVREMQLEQRKHDDEYLKSLIRLI